MKKLLTMITLLAFMGLSSMNVNAQDGTAGPLTWSISNSTLTISGSGAMPDYSLSLRAPWYDYRYAITTVIVGDSVTTIGNYAFDNCVGSTSITIGNSVTMIGTYAFYSCYGFTSITIPNSVTTIGNNAFYSCHGLTSITIPNSVTMIGNSAFSSCEGLTAINVEASHSKYSSNGGILYNKLQDTLMVYPGGKAGAFEIPNSVTTIGYSAFSSCYGLTSITIPHSVTTIGDYAFFRCSGFTSITIPNSVTTVGNYAFFGCSELTSITIPNGVTTIGNSVFSDCIRLTSITIPHSVTNIGNGAFFNCSKLTAINVEVANAKYSSNEGVLYNKLQDTLVAYPVGKTGAFEIPHSVTTLGNDAFFGCKGLTSITIPNSVTTIGNRAFWNCSGLTSITIPNSVTTIGYQNFYNSGLTSITIPHSVTSVGVEAFRFCRELTSITIPHSVTTIEDNAFSNCSGLTEIHIKAIVPPTLGESVFSNVPDTIPVYVPCQSAEAYQTTEGWSYFSNIVKSGTLSVTVEVNDSQMGSAEVVEENCETATAIIQATANEGYRFVQWQDGNDDNPRTLNNPLIGVFTAEFEMTPATYTITVLSNNDTMGTVTGGGSYEENAEVTITATPAANHRFVQWQDGNTDNPRMVTITEDATYTAEFVSTIGISESTTFPYEVYTHHNTLIIKQAEGQPVTVFDMMGRCVLQTTATEESTFNLPTAGVYIVRVGEGFVRKVVVNE